MAIADIQLPDGRIAQVEIPDGMDMQAAQSQLQSMYEQGAFDQAATSAGMGVGVGNDSGGRPRSILDRVAGAAEVAGNVASSVAAEPLAGLAGIASMVPGGRSPTEAITATRDALRYEPRTDAGREYLRNTGEALQPVGEAFQWAEDKLGNAVFEKTGSPTLAAAAVSLPTLITELVGVGAVKGARAAKAGRQAKQAERLLKEAAPSRDQLRQIASGLYREIDEMGAMVDSSRYQRLVDSLSKEMRSKGIDPDITPKAQKALDRMRAAADDGAQMSLSDLETLREVAKNAAGDVTDKRQAMLGSMMVERIDDFMGQPGVLTTNAGSSVGQQVQARYKAARDLWGRMRRSELLDEAVQKAERQASGFENGLRIQFRSILNNKKQRQFFQADELKAMDAVVKGSPSANAMKLLGKFGFGEQQATNMLGGSISTGVGATVGNMIAGPPGAFVGAATTAGAGSAARRTATRMTKNAADMADSIVRAGRDGRKIALEYVKRADSPNPAELAEILIQSNATLPAVQGLDEFTRRAVELAARRRAEIAGAASAGAVERGTNENVIPFAVGQ